jgi:hypothetical protein
LRRWAGGLGLPCKPVTAGFVIRSAAEPAAIADPWSAFTHSLDGRRWREPSDKEPATGGQGAARWAGRNVRTKRPPSGSPAGVSRRGPPRQAPPMRLRPSRRAVRAGTSREKTMPAGEGIAVPESWRQGVVDTGVVSA